MSDDSFYLPEVPRGALVRCIGGQENYDQPNVDPSGANVEPGTWGVVFMTRQDVRKIYGDNSGPMVRWSNGHACNVFAGDIEVVVE